MTVELTGVVGAFGNDPATIRTNSYSGLLSGVPADFFGSSGTVTTLAAGTPFTARYTIDLGLMPAEVLSTATSLDPGAPTPTHQSTGGAQWVLANLSIGGFNFSTEAGPDDVAPVADPVAGESTFIDQPLSYGSSLSYGAVPTFFSEGFMAGSTANTSHTFLGPLESRSYFRFASLSAFLYRSTFAPSPFLPGGGAFPGAFEWIDSDAGIEFNTGFAFGGFFEARSRAFVQGGDVLFDADFVDFDFPSGLQVLSARATTDIPEPASVFLTGWGLGALALRRRRAASVRLVRD